ncbi:MAG: LPS-assembly protein LptD [Acidiferrobacterales bacterium]
MPGCPQIPAPEAGISSAVRSPSGASETLVYIDADRAIARLNKTSTFAGNVGLRRGNICIGADKLTYDSRTSQVHAAGHITLRSDGGDIIHTPILNYSLDKESGYTSKARFHIASNGARGKAKTIRLTGNNQLQLDDMRYTTCPPGNEDWLLSGTRLDLDKATSVGTAHNVTLRFMHVPILYVPYFSFPLSDKRKSGFLAPSFGTSTTLGTFISAPYYFNLAPNYDLTLTPDLMTKHGLQLRNQFRYLGSDYSGNAQLEYLPHDQTTGTDRGAAFLNHNQTFSPYWSASANLGWVSDQSYFTELDQGTTYATQTYLPRQLQLGYGGPIWQFGGALTGYQNLDPTIPTIDQPYEQLPQLWISASSPSPPNSPHLHLRGEWDYFQRSDSVVGQRLDVRPDISLPLRNSYAFFIPKVQFRYTGYVLSGNGVPPPVNSDPQRTLPTYSVDTGLEFERSLNLDHTAYTQTLEPRLFYLYVPYRNQSTLPLFDAGAPDFSFDNLFRDNRFVGADRVGDADRFVFALTSKFLETNTGIQRLRLSVGRIVNIRQPLITLPPPFASTAAAASANTVGVIRARLSQDWYLRSGLEWDSHGNTNQQGDFLVQYHPSRYSIVNVGYRYSRGQELQSDVSAQWPLSSRWTGLARWNYSQFDHRTLQGYVGLQYRSCCWAIRIVKQDLLLATGVSDNAVVFELELTGLGKLGTPMQDPLQQGNFIFQ